MCVCAAVIPSLETLVACLLKALDPRDPNRTQALKEVSATLRVVLKHFPMTAYHKVTCDMSACLCACNSYRYVCAFWYDQGTNRLAVGLVDCSIVLYDLTTTSKLRVFKGHEGRPSCIAFNPDGDHIASYSAQDAHARIWQVGPSGLSVCFVMARMCACRLGAPA